MSNYFDHLFVLVIFVTSSLLEVTQPCNLTDGKKVIYVCKTTPRVTEKQFSVLVCSTVVSLLQSNQRFCIVALPVAIKHTHNVLPLHTV